VSLAAHGAEGAGEAAVALGDERHQRVRRPPAGRQLVRVARDEREERTAVVQQHPGLRLEHPRAEAPEQALDQRDGEAVAVGRDDGDRVAARLWTARRRGKGGPPRGGAHERAEPLVA
jgi:hypothetical protein